MSMYGCKIANHNELRRLPKTSRIAAQGAPLCARPLEPLCAAASEAQLGELRRFLNEGAHRAMGVLASLIGTLKGEGGRGVGGLNTYNKDLIRPVPTPQRVLTV